MASLPNESSYKYDVAFLYCEEESDEDQQVTQQILKTTKEICKKYNLSCYDPNDDALLGQNIFKIKVNAPLQGQYIIVILTKSAMRDHETTFFRQVIQLSKIKREEAERFVVIRYNVEELPDELALHYSPNIQADMSNWNHLKRNIDQLLLELSQSPANSRSAGEDINRSLDGLDSVSSTSGTKENRSLEVQPPNLSEPPLDLPAAVPTCSTPPPCPPEAEESGIYRTGGGERGCGEGRSASTASGEEFQPVCDQEMSDLDEDGPGSIPSFRQRGSDVMAGETTERSRDTWAPRPSTIRSEEEETARKVAVEVSQPKPGPREDSQDAVVEVSQPKPGPRKDSQDVAVEVSQPKPEPRKDSQDVAVEVSQPGAGPGEDSQDVVVEVSQPKPEPGENSQDVVADVSQPECGPGEDSEGVPALPDPSLQAHAANAEDEKPSWWQSLLRYFDG